MNIAQINISELSILLKALEIAINKKTYNKPEIDTLFPIWNNLLSTVDKINRTNAINQLYAYEISKELEEKEKQKEQEQKEQEQNNSNVKN